MLLITSFEQEKQKERNNVQRLEWENTKNQKQRSKVGKHCSLNSTVTPASLELVRGIKEAMFLVVGCSRIMLFLFFRVSRQQSGPVVQSQIYLY